MTILQRALFRESSRNTLGIMFILILLLSFVGFAQVLAQATSGKFAMDVVFPMFGLRLLRQADTVIPLALFLGVLFTVNRWYRDSEMLVINACGISLLRMMFPVAILSMIGTVLVVIFSLYIIPWAGKQIAIIQSEATNLSRLSGLRSGAFNAIDKKGGIFYARRIDQDTNFSDAFIRLEEDFGDKGKTQNIIRASKGYYKTDPVSELQHVVLNHGRAYQGIQGLSDQYITEFNHYFIRFEPNKEIPIKRKIKYMETGELLNKEWRRAKAELHWRIGRPISCLLLTMMAVSLAYSSARKAGSSNLFGAVFVFFFYNNLLTMGEGLIRSGKISPSAGLWWVHALALLAFIYITWRRVHSRPILYNPLGKSRSS